MILLGAALFRHAGRISFQSNQPIPCAITWLLILTLTGCASEGPLRPPSLHLPAPVRDLSAERAGDVVILRWTTPRLTTDGVALTGKHGDGQLTAAICREELVSPEPSCTPIAQPGVTSGNADSFSDPLPQTLTTGVLRPLRYRIRILNGRGKGANYSVVDTLAGPAPPPLGDVQVQPIVGGAELHWQKSPSVADLRTQVRVQRGTDQKAVLLAVDPTPHDPGGALDFGAKVGVEQHYSLTRNQTVTIDGKPLTISSAPVTVVLPASAKPLPPAPPAGLQAIVMTLAGPEIDLVWHASGGAAMYKVYRSDGSSTLVMLAAVPQSTLTYTDTAVRPSVRYRYSVSAVDVQGAEGASSGEIAITVPSP